MSTWKHTCIQREYDGTILDIPPIVIAFWRYNRMKKLGYFTPCLLLVFPLALLAQSGSKEQIQHALLLEHKGQYAQALEIFRSLVGSNQIETLETGRIWTYIGYAYQEEGDFNNAQTSYERAMNISKNLPSDVAGYATAIDNLADLYRTTGKLKIASRLEQKSLHLFEKSKNHTGAAWAFLHLAVIELTRQHQGSAERYLNSASKQASLTHDLNKDYYASFYSEMGWLSELDQSYLMAIAAYQRSIMLQDCEGCMLTGWTQILLGKAYAENGQLPLASENMRKGLSILEHTVGQHSPKYLAAEIAYARILDQSGDHAQSIALQTAAQKELSSQNHEQCRNCRRSLLP